MMAINRVKASTTPNSVFSYISDMNRLDIDSKATFIADHPSQPCKFAEFRSKHDLYRIAKHPANASSFIRRLEDKTR